MRALRISCVTAIACVVATAIPTIATANPNPYGPGYRSCGSFKVSAQGYRIHVYASHAKCRVARRVQRENWLGPRRRKRVFNGGSGASGYVLLKRYPGWRCVSGSGGGSCSKGKRVAAYQVRSIRGR